MNGICCCLTLLLVQVSPLADEARILLDQKGTQYPYSAEYRLDMPPAPNAAGRSIVIRIYCEDRDSFYSEEFNDDYQSTILIRRGKVHWKHSDAENKFWATGSYPADKLQPTELLNPYTFIHSPMHSLDPQIVTLLRRAVTTNQEDADPLVGEIEIGGKAVVHLEKGKLTIKNDQKALLEYDYRLRQFPVWAKNGPSELLKAFDGAKDVRNSEPFNMDDILQEVWEEGQLKEVGLDGLKEVAKKLGYWLPTKGTVIDARAIVHDRPRKELQILIQYKDVEYLMGQHLPSMPPRELIEKWVIKQRKFGRYEALLTKHPSIGALTTYIFSDDVSFIVSGDQLDDPDFIELIQSFALVNDPAGGVENVSGDEK